MRAAKSSGAYLCFLERTVAFLFTHDRYFSLPRWKREFGCRRSRVRVKRPPARVTVRTYAHANDDFPDVEGLGCVMRAAGQSSRARAQLTGKTFHGAALREKERLRKEMDERSKKIEGRVGKEGGGRCKAVFA